MTLTSSIVSIEADWIRVPLWSLYFPLVLVPDFVLRALLCAEGRKRLLKAQCWHFMGAMYLIGIDGW